MDRPRPLFGQNNICGVRIKIGRGLQEPKMSQDDLALKVNGEGLKMTAQIVADIEEGRRCVCDGELLARARALHVSLDWLCDGTQMPSF